MVRLYHNNCCKETFFGQIKKNKIFPSSCDFVGVFRNALSAPRIVNPPPQKKQKFIFVTGNEKGVGYFPEVQFPSNNFPRATSHMLGLMRLRRLHWEPSAAARMG